MKNIFVNDIVKDKNSDNLVCVKIDIELYCKRIINKIFYSINKIEEENKLKLSDNEEIHSTLFDAIGMINRLSKNIESGDVNEKL